MRDLVLMAIGSFIGAFLGNALWFLMHRQPRIVMTGDYHACEKRHKTLDLPSGRVS